MFGLLAFHEIAARRGDGLRPEFLRLFRAHASRERLTVIPGGLAEIEGLRQLKTQSRRRPEFRQPSASRRVP